jgi:hypothetical protein
MDTLKLPNASELDERELTDSSYWKPIYEEITKIQEQRAIMNATICARSY